MTDRKKVIKGLEDSFANQGCGYMDGVGELYAVSGEDLQNAIALLKEQESVIDALKSDLAETLAVLGKCAEIVRCKDCKYHDEKDGKNFCDCGNRPDDWFCADGERAE